MIFIFFFCLFFVFFFFNDTATTEIYTLSLHDALPIWGFFGEIGMDSAWMVEHRRGMMAVDQHIKYKAELVSGDRVVVTTDVLDVSEKTIRILHTMTNVATGDVAATAEMVAVFVDMDNRSGLPLPPEVRAIVESLRDSK